MSEEETIQSFKSLMYNAKANWDYFSYEILFNFFSLYNNAIEENKKLKNTELNSLQKENEELKHKIEGQECVIETQAHNEEVYEKLVMKLEKENTELKEYISIAPNLDEMTAVKYRNIQQDAYIKGRAEEQQRAEQIIYENYIPIQKVKDKIRKNEEIIDISNDGDLIHELLQKNKVYEELLESEE